MKLGIWRLMTDRHNHTRHLSLFERRNRAAGNAHHDDSAEFCVIKDTHHLKEIRDDTNVTASLSTSDVSEELKEAISSSNLVKTKTKKSTNKKHVSFSNVQVRTYEVILGDNPDCSFPLSLGWRYDAGDAVDVDTYESQYQQAPPEKHREDLHSMHIAQVLNPLLSVSPSAIDYSTEGSMTPLPLSLHERRLRLRAQGHSEQSLRQAERKRRIQLSMEWASGKFPKEETFPYSKKFFLHYVL